jgi:hypothetical protein
MTDAIQPDNPKHPSQKVRDLLETVTMTEDVIRHYKSDQDCPASVRTLALLALKPAISACGYIRRSDLDCDETTAIKIIIIDLIGIYGKNGHYYD